MTTLSQEHVLCAVCSTQNTVTVIQSLYAAHWVGLDGRPPTLPRNVGAFTIHQCCACGYCAPDLSQLTGVGIPDVSSVEYRAVLEASVSIPAARRFCSYAYLAQLAGNDAIACWASLNAAWVCDDQGRRGMRAAVKCRYSALAHLDEANERGESLLPYSNFDLLLRLDLWRRTGQFDKVLSVSALCPGIRYHRFWSRIAGFQKQLASRLDQTCYWLQDALAGQLN